MVAFATLAGAASSSQTPDTWQIGSGPAVRLVPADENRVQALLVRVASLERGTLNHITAERRVAAAREVRTGRTVSLSRQLVPGDVPGALEPMAVTPFAVDEGGIHWEAERLGLVFHGYAFSHVDALSHAAFRGRTYNGPANPRTVRDRLGVETMKGARPPIDTRPTPLFPPLVRRARFAGLRVQHAGSPERPARLIAAKPTRRRAGSRLHSQKTVGTNVWDESTRERYE